MKTKLTDDYDINILKGMSQWRLYQQMQKKPTSENNFAGGIALLRWVIRAVRKWIRISAMDLAMWQEIISLYFITH